VLRGLAPIARASERLGGAGLVPQRPT